MESDVESTAMSENKTNESDIESLTSASGLTASTSASAAAPSVVYGADTIVFTMPTHTFGTFLNKVERQTKRQENAKKPAGGKVDTSNNDVKTCRKLGVSVLMSLRAYDNSLCDDFGSNLSCHFFSTEYATGHRQAGMLYTCVHGVANYIRTWPVI